MKVKGFSFIEISMVLGLMAIAAAGVLALSKSTTEDILGLRIIQEMQTVGHAAESMSGMLWNKAGDVTPLIQKYGGLPSEMVQGTTIKSPEGFNITVSIYSIAGKKQLRVSYSTSSSAVCRSFIGNLSDVINGNSNVYIWNGGTYRILYNVHSAVPVDSTILSSNICNRGDVPNAYRFLMDRDFDLVAP